MSSFRLKLPAPSKLIGSGIAMQVVGVIALSLSLLTLNAAALIVTIAGGAGLILLGWLAWVIVFFSML